MNVRGLPTTRAKLRYEVGNILTRYPRLYLPLMRLRHGSNGPGPAPVGSKTEITIEGFPRSANSFAVTAFSMSQPQPVRVAHHLHAGVQITEAARMGIPALALIRDPEDAILSRTLLLGYPYDTVVPAMKEYLRFYKVILPYRKYFVLATFDAVTTDFGAVVRVVNRRFGTDFREFEHTEENVKRCFASMEQRNRKLRGRVAETTVSRPSEERRKIKESLRGGFHDSNLAALRRRVYDVYYMLVRQTDI